MIKTVIYSIASFRLVEHREDTSQYAKRELFWEKEDGKDEMDHVRWKKIDSEWQNIAELIGWEISHGNIKK